MLGTFLVFGYLLVVVIRRMNEVLEDADIYTSDT
jgi:hypothetical protein